MRRLFLADVHANLPAFQAVLHDAGKVQQVFFLGDVVDWGPHPSECVDLLRDIGARAIRGNHDEAVLSLRGSGAPEGLPPVDWLHWTYSRLDREQLDFLASLPSQRSVRSCGVKTSLIHHPPGAPYLRPSMGGSELERLFAGIDGEAVYCGHSHKKIDRFAGGRRIVCLRAVGQSRDGDPRAGYAIVEDGVLEHRSVGYDLERVAHDIGRIGLDTALCRRWLEFLRTGYDREWSRED